MLGSTLLKYLIITILIAFLSACSSKSSDNTPDTPTTTPEEAIQEIVDFVDTSKNVSSPQVKTYLNAKIEGVTDENLDEINTFILKENFSNIDSVEELQSFVDNLVTKLVVTEEESLAVKNIIESIANNEALTIKDFTDANILGISESNIEAIEEYLLSLDEEKRDTKLEIQTLINNTLPDVQAPTISILGSNPINVNLAESYSDEGATASDNVDLTVTVTKLNTVDTRTLGTYTVVYFASDEAGNEATATRTVNVIDLTVADTEKPVITIVGKFTIEVLLNSSYKDEGATVSDNIDNNLVVETTSTVNTSSIGSYKVTYNASDSAGNQADTQERIVLVVNKITPDTQKPTLELNGSPNISISYQSNYTDEGALFSDNRDSDKIIYSSDVVDINTLGYNILNYNASDEAGNEALAKMRIVNVIDDEAPILTLLGMTTMTISYGSVYKDQGVMASDNYDSSVNVSMSGSVNTNRLGVYTLTYTAKDKALNSTTAITRKVTVADISPADIILEGEATIILDYGDTYTEQGAEANDNVDVNKLAIISGDEVNSSKLGTYIIRYNSTDKANNESIEVQRTVKVIDNEAPVIHLIGDAEITLLYGETYTEANAIATDNYDSNKTITPSTSSDTVDTSKLGIYRLYYNRTDSSGNEALQVIRTVTIGDDEAPVITLNGDEVITITAGDPYLELNATARDKVDGSVDVNITGTVDNRVVGEYILTYSARDISDNIATKTRTINVIANVAPTANAGGDQNLTEGAYILLDASGSFDSDGVITKYVWKDTSGGNSVTLYEGINPTPTIEPLGVGVHTLLLRVTDNNHTIDGAELTDDNEIRVEVFIGTSNVKKTGQTTSYVAYDDGIYKAGIEHSYSRADNNTTVIDHITGLMWQDADLSVEIDIDGSKAFSECTNLPLGGYTWRLPTRKELVGIVEHGQNPTMSTVFVTRNEERFWTSTVNVSDSDELWTVQFLTGTQKYRNQVNRTHYVRCVRTIP